MATYRIGGQLIDDGDPGFAATMAAAYQNKLRPVCVCREPGAEMYVARVNGRHIIKRMPNSGGQHAPACDSFEPPAELSGLGEVMGTAIQENPEVGQTALKLDFSLTKIAGRAAPTPNGQEADSVRTDGNKLTLRGLLHYLWEEAGFNRWSPGMAGRRSWYVIRRYLLAAADGKVAKGDALGDSLYIPEPFSLEHKTEIEQRRMAHLGKACAMEKGGRRLMVVVGEVKEIAPSRYGYKIVFKHLPDFHFMVNEDLHKRLRKRFDMELSLWDAMESTHLMAIGTFGVGASGVASLEEVALMIVTENWIPFDSMFEKTVIDAMTHAGRRFFKGMRYNLPASRPLACVVASDTEPLPVAMYVLPPGSNDDYIEALTALMEESKLGRWLWRAGDGEMPALPDLHAAENNL